MEKVGVPQIHIIPFDLGVVFYDVLTIDNSKNILFAKSFCDELAQESTNRSWKLTELFQIRGNIKHRKNQVPFVIDYKKCDFADQAICKAELRPDLFCYILSNGVGIFEFIDLECSALKDTDTSVGISTKPFVANYQRKVTQSTILNKASFKDVCPEVEEQMLIFREICWKLVAEGVKRKKIKHLRPFSSNINYKATGLSYVLTIYLFNDGEISEREMNNLLCSSMFSKVVNQESWERIDKEIKNTDATDNPYVIDGSVAKVYASWSAVAVVSSKPFQTIDDLRNNEAITQLIKVEAYVQSRWFVADNSMDNVNKDSTASMESLQRIASLMEFCQAELDNEISANMGTLQKNLLKLVVETSSVKQLYKSVLNQIKTQLKIKEAHNTDKKRKNRLIADLFLAVFSASSLYKTILDLIEGQFGWLNWVIFGAMMIVAVGTIIFNYKNR